MGSHGQRFVIFDDSGIYLLCLNLTNLQTWYHLIGSWFVVLAIRTNVREKLHPHYLKTPPDHHKPRPEKLQNRQDSDVIFM